MTPQDVIDEVRVMLQDSRTPLSLQRYGVVGLCEPIT
jgi:hypothetical protein